MFNGTRITISGAVLNPAIGLGTNLVQLFAYSVEHFKWVWIYSLLPFAGSVVAVLFYEFVFKKTQEILNTDDEGDDMDYEDDRGSILNRSHNTHEEELLDK